ncbi:MAG TPA: cytochrome c [Draconibacterium sp.]|nr:cytochrome c [Draconibacterium sp.]
MKIKFILLVLSLALLAACSGNKKSSENTANTQKSVIVKPDSAQKKAPEQPGKKVYNSVCLACHMADGSGVPGMHPPLIESDFVNGDPNKLIGIVLHGIKGQLEVKGEVYNSVMPPQANLSDQQIADVLTYVRSNFGNNAEAIALQDVQKIRNAK